MGRLRTAARHFVKGCKLAKFASGLGLALALGGCLGYDGDIQHGYVVDERALAQEIGRAHV